MITRMAPPTPIYNKKLDFSSPEVEPQKSLKKVCINGPVHMTKLVIMPIYGKNLINLLHNQKSYNHIIGDSRMMILG